MTELVAAVAVMVAPALLLFGWLAAIGLAVAVLADGTDADAVDPLEPTERRPTRAITPRPDPTLAFPAGAPVH
jgi:hypothetical protein